MGNQNLKSSSFDWTDSEHHVRENMRYKRRRNREPGVRNKRCIKRGRRLSNVIASSETSLFDFHKIRNLFGDKTPVLVALLTFDSLCQLLRGDDERVKHSCYRDRSKSCQRTYSISACNASSNTVRSYPCTTFCAECDKKSLKLRIKQKYVS